MITIKQLQWSNAFSYGPDNVIDFSTAPLTQLVGKNGHGKSSIALILEEVLFNKNSKGIKKGDILNRYSKAKSYSVSVDFDKDGVAYTINSVRGATQTVKLLENGVDVSAHTATQTYKQIEEILGFDHKTFAQIVYQSNASSLEFLTAADTARKKFLIEILNLSKYTRAQEVFKEISQAVAKDTAAVQSQIITVNQWLSKYSSTDLNLKPLADVPDLDPKMLERMVKLDTDIVGVDATNKRIAQNNTYKQLQAKIKILPSVPKPQQSSTPWSTEIIELNKTVKDSKAFVKKITGLPDTCPTCLQSVDQVTLDDLVSEQTKIQQAANTRVAELTELVEQVAEETKQWKDSVQSQESWEKYHQLIDADLESELLNKNSLQSELDTLQANITILRTQIARVEKLNKEITQHNSRAELVSSQLLEMNCELGSYQDKLEVLTQKLSIIQVLTKTFSTTGLVAYKIECLVKDLEELTNHYLVDLSDGRFQISFRVSSSDKLNVVITDNGRDIEMLALSGGERARVNVATLLAIRKLMQTLSSTRINLLILDETVEALDVDGKDKLVEVLLAEEHLNTFLVSHGFSHPLLEKINVVKHNNLSFIEI